MAETLTQRDIDALVKGAAPTESRLAPEVEPFNFIRPQHVSKERRAALEIVQARFASSLQAMLTSRLRSPIDVTLVSVEQVPAPEFTLSLPSPCAAFVFRLGDRMSGEGVLDLGTSLAYHLVDRLFGGLGDAEPPARALSGLEQGVVRGIAERALAALADAWQDQLQLHPELTGFESFPETLHPVVQDERILASLFEVRSGDFVGTIALGLPLRALESSLPDSTARAARSGARSHDPAQRAVIHQGLQSANVSVSVRLPVIALPTREVASLAVGQVLHTQHPLDDLVELHVNGRLLHRGTLGQIRRRVALRIVQTVTTPIAERSARNREGSIV